MKHRGYRRSKTLAKYIKRLEYAYDTNVHNCDFEEFMIKNKTWLSKLKDTGTLCSCYVCGNPRKYLKELTKQEINALQRFKEQINEYFNIRRRPKS